MKTLIKSLTAVAAFGTFLSTAAAAQDAEQWQGFYAGARVNMQNLDISGVPFGIDPELNAGIFGGYNHAVAPNFVLGGEVSFDSELDYTVPGPNKLKLDNNIGLRARGGYAFGNSLLYGTLGYAWSDWNVPGIASGSADGFVYGIGLETLVTDKVSARFEYTRTDYDFSGPGLGGRSGDVDTFSVGVSYKF